MAVSCDKKNGIELRIHENPDGLSTDLAEYIAALSEASVKERGAFAIALSGRSLISLMRYVCAFCSLHLSPKFAFLLY